MKIFMTEKIKREAISSLKGNKGRATIASILIAALLVLTGSLYLTYPARAAALTGVKDTLGTSAPTTNAKQTISYTSTTAVAAGQTVLITFGDSFGTDWVIPSFASTDVSYTGATMVANVGACTTGTQMYVTTSNASNNKTVTFTACGTNTSSIAAGAITIVLGTGATLITNPDKNSQAAGTAAVYTVTIGGTQTDSGSALVAIIEGVTVSVTVDEALTFSIAGVANSSCTQGGSATAVTTTTATVPFGTSGLAANNFYKGCHDLAVSTNASGGYVVTEQENTSLLRSGADAGKKTIDDAICDGGTCTEVIANANTWATASANQGFGFTCNSGDCDSSFSSATKFASFACAGSDAQCDPGTGSKTAKTAISGSGVTAGTTSRIIYKLSFSAAQPAGTYSNSITYVAIPTF